MRRKEIAKRGIVLLLSASMLLGGCGSKPEEAVNENTTRVEEAKQDRGEAEALIAGNELAASLKEKYNGTTSDYTGETITVDRTASIEIPLGYNPYEKEESLSECFDVYQDAELTQVVDINGLSMEYDETDGVLRIEAPYYGIAELSAYGDTDLSGLSGSYLFDDEQNGWGNLPQYYLAQYVDTATGKKLDKPVVTVVKVNAEIKKAPQMKFAQTEKGEARLYWEGVAGAEQYLVFTIKKWPEQGFDNDAQVVGITKSNEWICEGNIQVDEEDDRIVFGDMNELFRQYYISDDDAEDIKNLLEETGLEDEITESAYDEYWEDYFGVIAVGANGCSYISNLMSAKDMCHLLPNGIAYKDGDEGVFSRPQGTLNLPSTMGITMCDGKTAQKVIDYDFDKVVVDSENKSAEIKATAHGTYFSWPVAFDITDMDALEGDLAKVKARQEELLSKGGNIDKTLNIEDGKGESKPEETGTEEEESKQEAEPIEPEGTEGDGKGTPEPEEAEGDEKSATEDTSGLSMDDMRITANSALSAYIAISMLQNEEIIDLSAFPEAADTSLVADAFGEAQYQNPLILGIQDASMDTDEQVLYVQYDYDRETTEAKQEEIKSKVADIISEIVTDDMTDLEKEMAINDYLCANAEYDDGALENAEANDFYYVDEAYYDSFTAYGTLIDGVGVCASYSAAFKLLCDEAGLDSIVVTGYLEGNLPHAWNKVKVEDTWNIVDSTNNDNEVIPNALFNLSDDGASMALTEDDRFVMDGSLYDYIADSDDNEYYRAKGNYYPVDEIAEALAAALEGESDIMLRTDYDLDDYDFNEVAQQAADGAGKDLQGCYWMGVIRMMEQ